MSSRAHSSHPSAHYNEYGEPLGGGVEPEVRAGPSRAKTCLRYLGAVCGFLFSHIGLLSLVVGYCIMGAFIFEELEQYNEILVKRNMTKTREAVTEKLWDITRSDFIHASDSF